jgi:hypothetical protein
MTTGTAFAKVQARLSSLIRCSSCGGAMSAWGQSRRFCDVRFSVRYPQYRTLSRPIGTGLPGSFLRPNCLRSAQPREAPAFCPRSTTRHELHPRSTKTRHINCVKSALNLLASCLAWFCPMAVWRRIAQDRRGADNRPLDSKIKANRVCWCGRRESRCLHIGLVQGVNGFLAARAMCARSRQLCSTS